MLLFLSVVMTTFSLYVTSHLINKRN